MLRALGFHQCGPGSNPGVDAICGLSSLLVLSLVSRVFLRVLRDFSLSLKTNTSKLQFDLERTDKFQESLSTPKCSMSKQISNYKLQEHQKLKGM